MSNRCSATAARRSPSRPSGSMRPMTAAVGRRIGWWATKRSSRGRSPEHVVDVIPSEHLD